MDWRSPSAPRSPASARPPRSACCRRWRGASGRRWRSGWTRPSPARCASTRAHRDAQAFVLLQRQAELMPALVDRLQAMTHAIEQQAAASNARLEARQDAFHTEVQRSYEALAASVGQSLATSVAEGSRAVAASLQPVVADTLAGVARETDGLRQAVAQAVERQLTQLSSGFEAASTHAADSWRSALDAQRQ